MRTTEERRVSYKNHSKRRDQMNIRTVLFVLVVSILLSSCGMAMTRQASDGLYYRNVGGFDCHRYKIVRRGVMQCFDTDGQFTFYRNAMSTQDVMIEKMEDLGGQIQRNQNKIDELEYYQDCAQGLYYC
jgi:TolA-binding protein